MRVRCERLVKSGGGGRGESREPLPPPAREFPQVGHEYIVYAVWAVKNPEQGILPVEVLLFDDPEGRPAWYSAAMFSVTSGRVPSTWEVALAEGELMLAPRAWLREGFWGDVWGVGDALMDAVRVLRHEMRLIEREDPLPADRK